MPLPDNHRRRGGGGLRNDTNHSKHNHRHHNHNSNDTLHDGRQLRKAVARRTVSYNSSTMRWLLDRPWLPEDVRQTPTLQPHLEATVDLLPPSSPPMLANSISSTCTKFVHCSRNQPSEIVHSCAWAPDGGRLLSGGDGGDIALWYGLTFNFETIVQGAHDSELRVLTWSQGGDWLLSGDMRGVVKYWLPNMDNLKVIKAHEGVAIHDIAFSTSGGKFATCADDRSVKVWDFGRAQAERTMLGHLWDVRSVDWHGQLPLLASGSKDGNVKVWDARSGQTLSTLHGHKRTIAKVRWHRNGNWIVSGSHDTLLKIFDIRMMLPFQTLRGHRREVTTLQWHPHHNDLLVSASIEGAILFWTVSMRDAVAQLPSAHQDAVWDLDWHPVGHMLATVSKDETVKFWTRQRPGDSMDDRYNSPGGNGGDGGGDRSAAVEKGLGGGRRRGSRGNSGARGRLPLLVSRYKRDSVS